MPIDLSKLPDPKEMPGNQIDLSGLPDSSSQILSSNYRNSQSSPDEFAQVRDYSKKTGIPMPVTLRNLSEVKKQANEPDWESLSQTSPKATKALRDDIEFFNLANDDIDNLTFWEKKVKSMSDAFYDADIGYKRGRIIDDLGMAYYAKRSGDTTQDKRIKELEAKLQDFELIKGNDGFIGNTAEIIGQMSRSYPQAIQLGMEAGTVAGGAAAIAGQAGPQALLPEEIVTVPAAYGAGFTAGLASSLATHSYQVESGQAYNDMIEAGIDPKIAEKASMGVGILNAALEIVGVGFVARPFKKAASKMFADKSVEYLTKETTLKAVKEFTKDYLIAFTGETAEEIGQEIVSVLGEDLAKLIDPKELQPLMATEEGREQVAERIGEIAEKMSKGMALLALPGASINLRTNIKRAQNAQENLNKFKALEEGVQGSKLLKRSPEAFQNYVEQLIENGPIENVYLDSKEFFKFFQSQGINPREVAREVPSISAQLDEALTTGGDLVIPLPEYTAKIAGTEYNQGLVDHLRFRPEDMSAAEAKQWQSQASEEFQREADKVLEARSEDADFQQSADQVKESIKQEILNNSDLSNDVADAYSTLVKNITISLSSRLGMSPLEFYQKYRLGVRVPPPSAELSPPPGEAVAAVGTPSEAEMRRRLEPKEDRRSEAQTVDKNKRKTDRRQDAARREKISAMPLEDQYRLIYTNELTGLNNRRAFNEDVNDAPVIVSIDIDSLGPVNDNLGQTAGDNMLKTIANALHNNAAGQVYHISGDEFYVLGEDQAAIEASLQAARQALSTAQVVSDKGSVSGFNFSYGVGETKESADSAMKANKKEREATGERAAKGKPPKGMVLGNILNQDNGPGSPGWEAAKAKGLDMSKEARMQRAKEMGFDVTKILYHGTQKEFDSFDSLYSGSGGATPVSVGFFFDSEEENALQYGKYNVLSVFLKTKNSLKLKTDENTHGYFDYHADDIMKQVDRHGYDSVIIENKNSRMIWVRDAEQIRSINAAFDPDQAESPFLLAQTNRGFIQLPEDITKSPAFISLLEEANLSTFFHELGHFYFEVLGSIASSQDAPVQIQKDMQILLDWFGVKDIEAWNKLSREQRRVYHEQFARGFEAYLFEGKAPNIELRELFSRFRSWLIRTYNSIKYLNVDLTDEVRGVMDRLIATDEQIKLAQTIHSYKPLFDSIEQSGMTKAEWADYLSGNERATREATEALDKRSLSNMRWLANAKSRIIKELQRDAKAKRAEVRSEVSAEVNSEPVYRAIRFLKHGEIENENETIKMEKGSKIDRDLLAEMYPPGELASVDWKTILKGMTAENGLAPDLVAEMFGFSSGDQLVKAIRDATSLKEEIETRTDQRMLERYGDLTNEVEIERAAEEAIHNEARARFVAAEHKALAKKLGSRRILASAAKAYAEDRISRKPIHEAIKHGIYTNAEIKSARLAEEAMRKGRSEEALIHKRAQILNFYMARAAIKAKERVDKQVAYARSFKGSKLQKIRESGDHYYDQLVSILDGFEFRQVTMKALVKRQSMKEWITRTMENAGEGNPFSKHESLTDNEKIIAEQESIEDYQGNNPNLNITDEMLQDAKKINYKLLTLEELQGIYDSLKMIQHLSGVKNRLLSQQSKRELNDWVTSLVTSIEKNASQVLSKEFGSTRPLSIERINSVKEFLDLSKTPTALVKMLDGYENNGIAWNLLGKPLQEAGSNEIEELNKANKTIKKIYSRYSNKELRRMNSFRYDERLGVNITKHDALSVLLNYGSKEGRQRVLDGFGITESDARYIMDTYLEEKDIDFAKDVWKFLGSYKEDAFSLHRDLFGFTPKEAEPLSFETRFGVLDGGYYPIKYDPAKSAIAEQQFLSKESGEFSRSLQSRQKLGSNIERVARVYRPLQTDMTRVIFGHVSDVIHKVSFGRALFDAGRILANDKVKRSITEHYGEHIYRQLATAIRNLKEGTEPVKDIQDKVAMHIRNNATLAMLGASIRTIILQPFGITNSLVKARMSGIGSINLIKGYARYMKDPAGESLKMRKESLYMKNREQTQSVAISRIKNKIRGLGTFDAIRESGMIPIMKSQFYAVDAPLYLASRDFFINQGLSKEKAIGLAEQVVKDAQGGGNVFDTAEAMQGGPFRKLFTNYLTYMITTYNLQSENYQRTFKLKKQNVFDFTVNTFVLMTMPAVLTALLSDYIAGDDDDEDFAKRLTEEQIQFILSMTPLTAQFSGVAMGFDYEGPQGTAIIGKAGDLMTQMGQGELDEPLIRSGIWVMGLLTGLPAAQTNRTVFGLKDAIEKDKGIGTTVKQAAFGPER